VFLVHKTKTKFLLFDISWAELIWIGPLIRKPVILLGFVNESRQGITKGDIRLSVVLILNNLEKWVKIYEDFLGKKVAFKSTYPTDIFG